MKDNGLVSIITPSYNCERFIVETVRSIQAQTYRNWELVITDDCSSDNTFKTLLNLAKTDSRIKLHRFAENKGSGAARNNSILHAEGRYIAFCDSDDIWFPEKLERQISFMQRTGCDLSYSSYATCDENGEINGFVECLPFLDKFRITRDNGIGCLTAIYDTSKIGKHFMPLIRKRQDWGLWIDIICKTGKALGLQEPLALYRHRNGSISSNKFKMLKYNYAIYRNVLGFSHFKSSVYLGTIFLPYYFYKKLKQKSDFRTLKNNDSSYRNLFKIKSAAKPKPTLSRNKPAPKGNSHKRTNAPRSNPQFALKHQMVSVKK